MLNLISRHSRAGCHASYLLLLCGLLTGCSENVLTSLDQRNAHEAQIVLERAGISAQVTGEEGGTFAISVDSKDGPRALELLSDVGLPRQSRSTVADLFPGNGFLVTPFEQKARLSFAVEQQLAETLSDLNGVAAARVHIVLPEDNGRGLIKERARASALLEYRPDANLADIEMKSRAILLNSIRGLAYEDVSVVTSPWSEVSLAPPPRDIAPAETSPQEMDVSKETWRAIPLSRSMTIIAAVALALAASLLLWLPRRKEGSS